MRALLPLLLVAVVAHAGEADGGEKEERPFEWNQLQGNAAHAGVRVAKDEVVIPMVVWRAPQATGQPTLRGGWLYCGGPQLGRYAARTGKFEPSPQAEFGPVGKTPALTDDAVIVRRPGGIVEAHTLDLRRRLWSTETRSPDVHMDHPVVVSGGFVVLNEGSGITALHRRTGKRAWNARCHRGEVAMTPAIADGRVFYGSVGGGSWAVELTTGKHLWRRPEDEMYGWAIPVVADGTLYMADRGYHFAGQRQRGGKTHAIDPRSGKVRWEVEHGRHRVGTPAIDAERVVVGTVTKVLILDRQTGKERLRRIAIDQSALGMPAIVGRTLYFGTTDATLRAHDLRDGKLLWKFEVPGTRELYGRQAPHEVRSIVHTGKRIFVETTNGLYCLVQDPNRRGKRPQGITIPASE